MSMLTSLFDYFTKVGGVVSIVLLIVQLISCYTEMLKEWMEWMPSVYLLATAMMLVYFLISIACQLYNNTVLIHAFIYLGLGSLHQVILNHYYRGNSVECE